jgi:hypothetical protein
MLFLLRWPRIAPRSEIFRGLMRWFLEDNAEARGMRLLREWLSEKQRQQLEADGYFDVVGGESGKKYRIRYGTGTNIEELNRQGRPEIGWCFVPEGHLVAGDVMLAQKIALETNEYGALAVAKTFPTTPLNRGRTHRPF